MNIKIYICILLMWPVIVTANPLGRVCLASLNSDANPHTLSAQVGQQKVYFPTKTDPHTRWITGLKIKQPYIMSIKQDGKVIQSFKFSINPQEFRNPKKPDLCLYYGEFYGTWMLTPVESTGSWCSCWSKR